MHLYNKLNKEQLIARLQSETFTRRTVSFYRYFKIDNPEEFRNNLYLHLDALHCLGRIYVAKEGINAQLSLPVHLEDVFVNTVNGIKGLSNVPMKWAVEDQSDSFLKLIIKVRDKVVADGLNDSSFDPGDVGKHLTAKQFNELMDDDNTVVVDMRNHYESEIGKFENAFCPDADTFRDAIKIVTEKYEDKKDKRFLLYCTGGIRCEKASAYLRHLGYKDVNQLHGGIIDYARQIKEEELQSKYVGKNFVFDNRLGESIDGQVISKCHQCGAPCDTHTNCANDDCHLLFIQCPKCAEKYEGCCSSDCKTINQLPYKIKKEFRVLRHQKYAESKIFKSRLRPNLMKMQNNNHYQDSSC